jgi:hypothetical protein
LAFTGPGAEDAPAHDSRDPHDSDKELAR